MKKLDFLKKKQKADADNNAPDPNGNNIIFGVRQQCINPTILNDERGGRKYPKPDFYDQNRVKKYWR